MSQAKIDSGFGPENTAEDVIKGIDLTGKTAIVTGGYTGLGLETTRVLVSAGCKVIVPVRSPDKATKNLAGISVEIENMDLTDPSSIDAFADKFIKSNRPLHLLINNAAIMASPLQRDSRGYEMQFSTNHLGHFQLTARLYPALQKANGARVISLSSKGHFNSPVVFDDWNYKNREYEPWQSYGQSKTANILFALQLDKKGISDKIRAFSLHPGGIITTELNRFQPREHFKKFGLLDDNLQPVYNPLRQWKTIPQGASTTVWCATSPLLEGKGGLYCENNNISPLNSSLVDKDPQSGIDPHGFYGVLDYAIDPTAAEKLWKLSEELTGVTF